ncbi:unnamed protein product [Ectocarpus sp. CCAP 1310/34]|nr:unnamed protein product [Ectocarpus sp. CCAP 1310/34]
MSAFALSNADLVAGFASILSTAACGGVRMRMSRFNSLNKQTKANGTKNHRTRCMRETNRKMTKMHPLFESM